METNILIITIDWRQNKLLMKKLQFFHKKFFFFFCYCLSFALWVHSNKKKTCERKLKITVEWSLYSSLNSIIFYCYPKYVDWTEPDIELPLPRLRNVEQVIWFLFLFNFTDTKPNKTKQKPAVGEAVRRQVDYYNITMFS